MNHPANPEISPAAEALLAMYAAHADFYDTPPGDDHAGDRLMTSYAAIAALDGTTAEGAYAKLEAGLEQASVAYPDDDLWPTLKARLRTLLPATLREAILA